jgi:exopolysaccharide production protein ExoQ
LAENGVVLGGFGGGPVARPNYERWGKVLAIVGFVLLGLLAMLVSDWVSWMVAEHYHRYREWILMGLFLGGVPLTIFMAVAVWEGIQCARRLFKELRWWHLLWFMLFVSFLSFRKRAASEAYSNPVDSAAGFRIVMVTAVGAILLFQLIMRRLNWLNSLITGIPGVLTWFALVCMLSTVWSVYWEWTLYKACEYSVDVAMLAVFVLVIKNSEQMKTWFEWTWLLYGALLCCVWFWVPVDPHDALSNHLEYGEQGIGLIGVQLQGLYPDVACNDIGQHGAVLGAVALARLLPCTRKRKNLVWYLALFGFGCVTMLFAQCRSAIMGFALAVFCIFLFSRRVLQGAIIVITGAITFVVSGMGTVLVEYMKRGQSTPQLTSLTQRLSWWAVAWEKFTDKPLTGLGAWAAGRFGVLARLGYKMTASMHSDWVEIIVGTGFWGIIPVLVVIVWTWWVLVRFIRNKNADGLDADLCLEAIGVLSVLTIRMFFMTELSWHAPLSFFVPIGYAEYLRRRTRYLPGQIPKLLFRR